jgi:hypothetical protein
LSKPQEILHSIASSRLYGCKFNEYKERPESMAADLPHRRGVDWREIADRLGWLVWEDFRRVNEGCCPWIP